jgi:hypothetical protein
VTIKEVSSTKFNIRMLLAADGARMNVKALLWMLLTNPSSVFDLLTYPALPTALQVCYRQNSVAHVAAKQRCVCRYVGACVCCKISCRGRIAMAFVLSPIASPSLF